MLLLFLTTILFCQISINSQIYQNTDTQFPKGKSGTHLPSAALGDHILLKHKLRLLSYEKQVKHFHDKIRYLLDEERDIKNYRDKSSSQLSSKRNLSKEFQTNMIPIYDPNLPYILLYKRHSKLGQPHKYICPDKNIESIAIIKTCNWLEAKKEDENRSNDLEVDLENYLFKNCWRKKLTIKDARKIRKYRMDRKNGSAD